jgi:hypothetical protein
VRDTPQTRGGAGATSKALPPILFIFFFLKFMRSPVVCGEYRWQKRVVDTRTHARTPRTRAHTHTTDVTRNLQTTKKHTETVMSPSIGFPTPISAPGSTGIFIFILFLFLSLIFFLMGCDVG